jgi:pentatricopeptide repeat protein
MSSLAKSGQIQKAEEILSQMETYQKQGRFNLSPNTISFNTLINAYAKARNPLKAEEVLRRMMALSHIQGDVESNVRAGTNKKLQRFPPDHCRIHPPIILILSWN